MKECIFPLNAHSLSTTMNEKWTNYVRRKSLSYLSLWFILQLEEKSWISSGTLDGFQLIWRVHNLVPYFKAQTMYDKNWRNSFWTINHQLPPHIPPPEFIILLALRAATPATHSFCRHHHNLENKDPHISAIHLLRRRRRRMSRWVL